ncbi:MAG: ABC transporter permease [Candidatus Freyarchaeota archaeon]|nr:ABC transporter permease [Candidatus Jordarchaeia archaeon]
MAENVKSEHLSVALSHMMKNILYAKWFTLLKDSLILLAIFVLLLAPIIYLAGYVMFDWWEINYNVFSHPIIYSTRWDMLKESLFLSFKLAFYATLFDVVIGVPVAFVLQNRDVPGRRILDTLVNIPLATPTSALGFATLIFWGSRAGVGGLLGLTTGVFKLDDLIGEGVLGIPPLLLLAHISFTFPYIVRSVSAVLEGIDPSYVEAAQTLGAKSFTRFRTITLPLMAPGVFAGSILAFTRSLGETGASIIVAGVFTTAPILVVEWKAGLLIAPAAFLSVILVATACVSIIAFRRIMGVAFARAI